MRTLMSFLNALAALALATATASFAQTATNAPAVTPLERQMAATIDANNSADQAFLEQLVNINSGTMHLAWVAAVKDVLMPRFQALGFRVRWTPMDNVPRAPAIWWRSIHVRQEQDIAASGCF
jgi:glutamate carboxypeptidase